MLIKQYTIYYLWMQGMHFKEITQWIIFKRYSLNGTKYHYYTKSINTIRMYKTIGTLGLHCKRFQNNLLLIIIFF